MIVVQHIQIIWTKRSRGMPGAAVRAALPTALVLPLDASTGQPLLVHRISFDEEEGFAPRLLEADPGGGDRYWSLWFDNADGLSVRFDYNEMLHGRPVRKPARLLVFQLGREQVGRFIINGRFASYSGQWYVEHLVNIANTDLLTPTLFTDSAPSRVVDKRADLF